MNKGVKIGLIALSGLAVFGLGFGTCYLLSSGKNKETNINQAEEKDNKSSIAVSSSIVNELAANIKDVYAYYYSSDYVNGFRTINEEKVLYYAITSKIRNTTETATANDIARYITKYFGENYNYTNHSILCALDKQTLFQFDNTTNTYSFYNEGNIHGHDGGNGYKIARNNYVKVLSSKYDGDNIVLETKILYGTNCTATCGPNMMYYVNPNDSQPILKGESINEEYIVTEADYQRIKDKLDTTTFIFSKNSDGTYYLSDVKIRQD